MTWQNGRPLVDWPRGKPLTNGRDPAIYEGDAPYPAVPVKLIGAGRMRQWRLAQVGVALFRWHPAKNRLERLSRGQLEVTFTFTPSTSNTASRDRVKALRDPLATAAVRQAAVNFASQARTYTRALEEIAPSAEDELPLSGDGGTYAVLTTAAIQGVSSLLADFVTHKAGQGYTVPGGYRERLGRRHRRYRRGEHPCLAAGQLRF